VESAASTVAIEASDAIKERETAIMCALLRRESPHDATIKSWRLDPIQKFLAAKKPYKNA
jgi:hypothetical protein